MRKFTLFFAALLVTLGVKAQLLSDQVDGYFDFAAKVNMTEITSEAELAALLQEENPRIVIQHAHVDGEAYEHTPYYLSVDSKTEEGAQYHKVAMHAACTGLSVFKLAAADTQGCYTLQADHEKCHKDDNGNHYDCFLPRPSSGTMTNITTTRLEQYIGAYKFAWEDGKGFYITVENFCLYVTIAQNSAPNVYLQGTDYGISNKDRCAYFKVYKVNSTEGLIGYVENASVSLVGPNGNTFTGTHSGWSDMYDFQSEVGATIQNVTYDATTNHLSGTVTFPFPVSGDYVKNPVLIKFKNYGAGYWKAGDTGVSCDTYTEGTEDALHTWYIYPEYQNGYFVYRLYNKGKGAYLKASSDNSDVFTNEESEAVQFRMDKPQSSASFRFIVPGDTKLYAYYSTQNGWTLSTSSFAYGQVCTISAVAPGLGDILELTTDQSNPVWYMIKNVRSGAYATYASKNKGDEPLQMHLTEASQPVSAQLFYFTGELSEDGSEAKVRIFNHSTSYQCAGLGDGAWNATGIEWGISASANTDNGGGLAIYKYENKENHGTTTGSSWNNASGGGQKIGWWKSNDVGSTWVLEKVPNVESRFKGTENLASAAPQNDTWAEGTKWFLLRKDHNLYVSTKDDYLKDGALAFKSNLRPKELSGYWTFVGNETDGYQIYNAAEGPGKILNITGEDGNARATLVPIAQATGYTRFDVRFMESKEGKIVDEWYLKVHGTDKYVNDRDGYFAFWNTSSAYGNNGSRFEIMPAPMDADALQAAVAAAKEKAKQDITNYIQKVEEYKTAGVPENSKWMTDLSAAIANAQPLATSSTATFAELYGCMPSLERSISNLDKYVAGHAVYVNYDKKAYYRLKHQNSGRYMTEVTAGSNGGLQIKDLNQDAKNQWFSFVHDDATSGEFFIKAYAGGQIYTEPAGSWHMKTQDSGVSFIIEQVSADEYKILKETGYYTAPNENATADGEIIYSNHNKPARTDLVWVLELVTEEELVGSAEELLNATGTGVGYPTAEARAELQAVIDAVKADNSKENEVAAAENAFKTTTNVNMPESGKAYVIRNVHPDGTKYMLSSAYTDAYLPAATDDAKDDAANIFVCRVVDGGYVFVNLKHGQYMLFHGINATNPYESDGFIEAYSENNVLKLNSHHATLDGALSIAGKRNRPDDGHNGYATMTISPEGNMNANSGENSVLYSSEFSSLFVFEEVPHTFNQVSLATIKSTDTLLTGSELVDKTISTFSAPYPTDLPDNVTAYYAAEAEEAGQLILKPVDGAAIPGKQGVVLIGNPNTAKITMLPAIKTVATIEGNVFAHSADGPVTMGDNAYILANGGQGIGIYKATAGSTLKQGKAYLNFTGSSANSFVLNFSGVTTDIEGAPTVAPSQQVIYDLSGRRVNAVTKGGIYIVNGKKMIIK